jgi:hypothetical protein
MKQQDYQCSITADVTAAEAFESISHVSAWWAKKLEGHSESLHDIFTVRFGDTYVTFEITEFVPEKKVVWHVTDCYLPFVEDKNEWTGTSIIWEISAVADSTSAAGDSTRVSMTHSGLVPEVECFEQCQKGWNRYIKESLFKYLTERVGLPA